VALSDLKKIEHIDTLYMVLPSVFSEDHERICKKYAFEKNSRVKVLYSDSLSDNLKNTANVIGSSILIYNTQQSLLYSASLKKMNIRAVNFFSFYDRPRILNSITKKRMNFKTARYERGVFILEDYFKGVYVATLKNNKLIKVAENDNVFVEQIYKALYSKEFKQRYSVMQRKLKEYPNMSPGVISASIPTNKPEIFLVYEVRDYATIKGVDRVDSTIITKNVLIKIDLKTKEKTVFLMDIKDKNLIASSPWSIIGTGKKIKMLFYKWLSPVSNSMFLADVQLEDSLFRVTNIKHHIRPNGYGDKLTNYASALHISKHVIAYQYADSLYNIFQNTQVHIPYKLKRTDSKSIYSSANFYNSSNQEYSLFYYWRPPTAGGKIIQRFMSFKASGELIEDKSIDKLLSKYKITTSPSFVHGRQMVIVDRATGQAMTVDL
jgi:hypothetical protein